jgi:pyruvate carboxylase subunit B
LEENNLPVTDENIFLVLSCMVPGKKMETNEGMRLLMGNPKIDVPLKKKEEPAPAPAPAPAAPVAVSTAPAFTGPVTTRIHVQEGSTTRTFSVTVEPVGGGSQGAAAAPDAPAAPAATPASAGKQVFSTFAGQVEVVDILKHVGDTVKEGDVVAAVEAMKAKHDIRAQFGGTVREVHVKIGDEIDSTRPIMTVA